MKKIDNNNVKPGDFIVSNQLLQIVSEIKGDYLYTISCGVSQVGFKKTKSGSWFGFPYGREYKIEEIFRINDLKDLKDNLKYMSRRCYSSDYDEMAELYTKIKSGNFKKWPIYKVGDTFTRNKIVVLIKRVLEQSYELECINFNGFTIINKDFYHTDFCDFRKISKEQYKNIKNLVKSVDAKRTTAERIIGTKRIVRKVYHN